jgi:hypothetical protein
MQYTIASFMPLILECLDVPLILPDAFLTVTQKKNQAAITRILIRKKTPEHALKGPPRPRVSI